MSADLNIPHKANRILNLVLLAFILIFLRTWYLGFIQGDYHKQQARKPQRRSLVERVERATIRDRFNIPLAQNKIDYAIAVRYADVRRIPSHQWEKENGKKVKKPLRSAYISSLAAFLGKELEMSPKEIEDTIYAKACLFPHTPFVIKESLSEEQYYKLRAVEKDWAGMEAQKNAKRVYPKGKVGCDIIGYMGAINPSEYMQVAKEITELETYIQKREGGELIFLPKGYEDPLMVRNRLALLKKKAYTINDSVGKTGIENTYDEVLRGVHGKKNVEVDPKGNVIRELPGSKKGLSGQRVFLSISSELQEYAEALLAEHEELRDLKDSSGETIPGTPWIKGGAVVVLDPKTGDVLSLASYPRIDPNDFVQSKDPFLQAKKQKSVSAWMESEAHIGSIWNGKNLLRKETYSPNKGWKEDLSPLTWHGFLKTIVPPKSPIWASLEKVSSVKNGFLLCQHFSKIIAGLDDKEPTAILQTLYANSPHVPCRRPLSSDLLTFLEKRLSGRFEDLEPSVQVVRFFLSETPYNDDKLLLLDLIRLLIDETIWSAPLLEKMGHFSLAEFFTLTQVLNQVEDAVKKRAGQQYHESSFTAWREDNFSSFLKKKRKEEKEKRTYTRPYTEYLEKLERKQFQEFWKEHKYDLIDAAIFGMRESTNVPDELKPYILSLTQDPLPLSSHCQALRTSLGVLVKGEMKNLLQAIRPFEDLQRPLYGKYRLLRHTKGKQLEKHLAGAFYPLSGFGFGRSQAFRQSTPQGSIFKLVVAYEALKERYEYLCDTHQSFSKLNPLTVVDELQGTTQSGYFSSKQVLGHTLEGEPIRRLYKGGVMPRSSHAGIGKVNMIQAIEQSSNIYFSLLAAEHIADPSLLEQAARDFGYGKKTGIDLLGEIPGNLPSDLADNKSGLYAFAIGQHSLVGTPLQAAVMLSSIGNKGKVLTPHIVKLTAGKSLEESSFLFSPEEAFPFHEPLSLIGMDFPLFTEPLSSSFTPTVHEIQPAVNNEIFLPEEIRQMLLLGMDQVVSGSRGSARTARIYSIRGKGKETQNYNRFKGQMAGKTGTAEILYKQWLDAESKARIHNHVWFGGLVFPESNSFEEEAELAVVVYLRFSKTGGKEAAPIVTKIAEKWREIKQKHQVE